MFNVFNLDMILTQNINPSYIYMKLTQIRKIYYFALIVNFILLIVGLYIYKKKNIYPKYFFLIICILISFLIWYELWYRSQIDYSNLSDKVFLNILANTFGIPGSICYLFFAISLFDMKPLNSKRRYLFLLLFLVMLCFLYYCLFQYLLLTQKPIYPLP